MSARDIIDRLKAALKHSNRVLDTEGSSEGYYVLHEDVARILNDYEDNMHVVDIAKRPWRMYGD